MVSSSLSPRDDTGKACSHAPSFSVAARSESCGKGGLVWLEPNVYPRTSWDSWWRIIMTLTPLIGIDLMDARYNFCIALYH